MVSSGSRHGFRWDLGFIVWDRGLSVEVRASWVDRFGICVNIKALSGNPVVIIEAPI